MHYSYLELGTKHQFIHKVFAFMAFMISQSSILPDVSGRYYPRFLNSHPDESRLLQKLRKHFDNAQYATSNLSFFYLSTRKMEVSAQTCRIAVLTVFLRPLGFYDRPRSVLIQISTFDINKLLTFVSLSTILLK